MGEQLLCVIGGPQASAVPWDERVLQECSCDIVVRGEGELPFVEILNWFLKGEGSLDKIDGLTYLQDGEIKKTPERKPARDLDIFPAPNRNLNYAKHSKTGIEFLVTSRGCPHRCAFCYEGRQTAPYRARGLTSVINEVEELVRDRQALYIGILDDTFTVNPKRVLEFCEAVKSFRDKYHDFRWFCEARANVIVKHPEIIRAMVEAGLIRIQIGVETGTQAVLDAYRKDLRLEDIRKAVEICVEADVLSIVGNFIIGGALENRETVNNSIEFAKELIDLGLGRFDVSSTIYTPYPGTPMNDNPEDFELEILDPDCETGPGDNYCFVRTKHLSKWEILHARQQFVEAVVEKITGLIPKVPDGLLVRHYEAYYRFGLRTSWLEFISHTFNYHNYFGLSLRGDHFPLRLLPIDDIEAYKPVRTIFVGSSRDGKLLLDLERRKVELNEMASFIYDHCYGKLSTGDIIDRVRQKYHPYAEREDIKSLVIKFFEEMDAEKLLIFTRF